MQTPLCREVLSRVWFQTKGNKMEISKGLKKALVGALLFLVLGVSALGGFGAHQNSVTGGVPAAYAGCCAPPPEYDDATPDPEAATPTPTPFIRH
jgi:hypothetical protein